MRLFERYTERARRVIFFARYEASQFGSVTIESEHMLLGILREDPNAMKRFTGDDSGGNSIGDELAARSPARERIRTSIEPEGALSQRLQGVLSQQVQGLSFRYNVLPKDGVVPDAETAMRICDAVWITQYGKETVEAQKPFHAERKLTMWIVTGSASSETALFAFILSQDCRVVSMGRGSAGS